LKTCFLDIEFSNLDADFGVILSSAIKPYGKPVKIFSVTKERPWDDYQVTKDTAEEVNQYDIVVTYYGFKADIPFFRTRLLKHDPTGKYIFLKNTLHHIDLYYVAKQKLKMHSNSLDAITGFFNIKGKTHLNGEMWARAAAGDEIGLKYVTYHNKYDVIILEKLYDILKDYVGQIRQI